MEQVVDRFQGYCIDENGRYTPAVHLTGGVAALQYVRLQMRLHYRVIVTDEEDCTCIEAIGGKIVFPDEATVKNMDA